MKNKKMGILAILVMLVAVTLNSVGGTYAKYISTYGTTDEARVAKWDFRDEATRTVDLFQNSYTKTVTADDGTKKTHTYVASSDAWKVIAPGTDGVYEYNITGTAETNYKVTPVLEITNNVKLPNGYDPLEFSTDGNTWLKADAFNAANKTDGSSKIYPANSTLSSTGEVHWRWVFETGNDDFDTELGRLAVAKALTVTAKIGVTVEQTQDAANVTPTDGKVYPTPHVSFTNNLSALSDAQKKELSDVWGYKSENANITFNGRYVSGTFKAYEATDKIKSSYGVTDPRTTNYFYTMQVTVPAGYDLINPTAYEGEDAKGVVISNKDGLTDKVDYLVINLKQQVDGKTPDFQYGLVNAAGDKTIYTISYQNLTFE